MSLKVQKIVKYIPIIQFITFFCWIKYCMDYKVKFIEFLKVELKMFVYLFLLDLPLMVLSSVFKNDTLDMILLYIIIYPALFGVASIAVAAQEKCEADRKRI